MGDGTGIEWTDATWNPLRGCSAVSEGCRNCYAAGVAARFSGPGMPYEDLAEMTERGPRWTGKVREVPEHLQDPLRWRKPRRVFVNSMSDLFHPAVEQDFIAKVFAIMALARQHTFQVLTKRPERMAQLLADDLFVGSVYVHAQRIGGTGVLAGTWPLPNVWLGTSVEDQKVAEERIPHLIRTPAKVRFLSCEPLLGPVNWRKVVCPCPWFEDAEATRHHMGCPFFAIPEGSHEPMPLGWVIVGGESGPNARPMDLAWARSLRDQCGRAGVAYFFKQTGAVAATTSKKGGTEADIPEDLRIRQFPVTA